MKTIKYDYADIHIKDDIKLYIHTEKDVMDNDSDIEFKVLEKGMRLGYGVIWEDIELIIEANQDLRVASSTFCYNSNILTSENNIYIEIAPDNWLRLDDEPAEPHDDDEDEDDNDEDEDEIGYYDKDDDEDNDEDDDDDITVNKLKSMYALNKLLWHM